MRQSLCPDLCHCHLCALCSVCMSQEPSAGGQGSGAASRGSEAPGGCQVGQGQGSMSLGKGRAGVMHSLCVCLRLSREQYVRLKKERDYHRMQHHRVLQEKVGLASEAAKLRKHFSSYEPLLQTLKRKYQVSGCALYMSEWLFFCSP